MEKIPLYSEDLIHELNKLYPECSADPAWSEREIWMKTGQRMLVRMLNVKLKETQADLPEVIRKEPS